MSKAWEVNFDGLIGPNHNYGGLSDGNLASSKNEGLVSVSYTHLTLPTKA